MNRPPLFFILPTSSFLLPTGASHAAQLSRPRAPRAPRPAAGGRPGPRLPLARAGVVRGRPRQLRLLDGGGEAGRRLGRAGAAWRQVDAVLLTTDLGYEPAGREKPPFAYLAAMRLRPAGGAGWRGAGLPEPAWSRPKVAGRDFSMWTGVDSSAKWWGAQK